MNVILWIVAGGIVGLMAFAALNLNLRRGLVVSIVIGMVAGYVGGRLLAPLFGATVGEAGDLNPLALLVAAATALGCLSLSDMMSRREAPGSKPGGDH